MNFNVDLYDGGHVDNLWKVIVEYIQWTSREDINQND